jgi:hypothetical protein
MAQYLVLIYGDETVWEHAREDDLAQLMKEHDRFAEAAGAALVGGNALQPTTTATAIRRDAAGEPQVTDGPFAETKEALGGYYLIEAGDLDEAIRLATAVPAPDGGVEVRPVMTFE